jgi:hypothetical protein
LFLVSLFFCFLLRHFHLSGSSDNQASPNVSL